MSSDSDFTFNGKAILKRIDRFTTSKGKTILTLIFETGGQYPQMVPVKVFGRLAEQESAWKPGFLLKVDGHLGGRDWNGKVYGDIVADSITVLAGAQQSLPTGTDEPPPLGDDDVPF